MILELTIGRDATTGQLRMSNGKQAQLFGEKECVPKSVSREHVCISVTEMGEIILKNLNVENDTYVNGKGIEQKVIKQGDKIELGNERWVLSWKEYLDPVLPKFADIKPLEKVWRNYENELIKLQIKQGRINALRSILTIVTPFSAILGGMNIFNNGNIVSTIGMTILFILGLFFLLVSWNLASNIPKQRKIIEDNAQNNYKCPHCHQLIPLQKYEFLRISKRCPHPNCKAIFIS